MNQDNELCNNLKLLRTRLGLSQQQLANLAGVTRQTISFVESGQGAPSVMMTLRLAKALGCQVEDLFWIDQDFSEIEAVLAKPVPNCQQLRVSLAQIGEKWIADPLTEKDVFRQEMILADDEIVAMDGFPDISELSLKKDHPLGECESQLGTDKVRVRLLDNTVVIAGCISVISLWVREIKRLHPQLQIQHNFANSIAALHSLSRGDAHIAGMHLYEPSTGQHNVTFAREVLAGKPAVLIALGVWEEGLMVQPGNPLGIKTVSDLVETGATIVNRELGSSSRTLLESKLQQEQVPHYMVKGFDNVVKSHAAVAHAIVTKIADAGISTASKAATFGLDFVPLHQSRYDLIVLKEYLEAAHVQQFLSTLTHPLVKSQLTAIGGYDTSKTGEVVANI